MAAICLLPSVPKMYLNRNFNFGAVNIALSEILGLSHSWDMCNLFGTRSVCFHAMMNQWHHIWTNLWCITNRSIMEDFKLFDVAIPKKRKDFLVPRTEHNLSSFKCSFLNIFSRQNLLPAVCHSYCFCYGGTNMARKNVWKTTFHSTFEVIQLQPIREQEKQ